MADLSIAIELLGKDHFSGVAGAAQKSLGGLTGALGNVASIAGGFVVAQGLMQLPGLLTDAAKAAAEEEKGIARLAQAVDNAGGSWAKDKGAIEASVKSREKLGFSDDALRSSLAMLTAQTGSVEEAQKRQAMAMDLSRGAGIDLSVASKLLGKVTDENVNVLGRYGISVEKGASQTELFAAIQQKFGGQSEAAAKTAAVQWEIFGNQMDNLKEDVGGALLPLMTDLGGSLIGLVAAVRDSDALQQVFDVLGGAADQVLPKFQAFGDFIKSNFVPIAAGLGAIVLWTVVPAFGAWATAAWASATATIAALAPVLLPLAAIGLAVGLMAAAWTNNWFGIQEKTQPIIDAITGTLERFQTIGEAVFAAFATDAGAMGIVLEQVREIFGETVADGIEPFVAGFMDAIPTIKQFVGDVGTLFGAFAEVVKAVFQGDLQTAMESLGVALEFGEVVILGQLAQWARAFVDWVGPMIPLLLLELGNLLLQLGTWMTTIALPAILLKLLEWSTAFVGWIVPLIPPFLLALGTLLLDLGTWMTTIALPAILLKLLEWSTAFVGWIVPLIPPFLLALGTLLLDLGTWMTTIALPAIVTNLVAWGGAFLGFVVKDVIPTLGAKLSEMLPIIGAWVKDTAIPAVGAFFATLGKAAIDALLGALKEAWSNVENWFRNLKWPSLPPLPSIGGGGGGGFTLPAGGAQAMMGGARGPGGLGWGAIVPNGMGAFSQGGTHTGGPAADIMAPTGSPIYAPVGGRSAAAWYGPGGHGTVIQGDDGRWYYMAHALGPMVGGRIEAGQQIGQVDSTGNARSPHLHLAVATNPGVFDTTGGQGNLIMPRAFGGPVSAGRTYLVGEHGPELLRMGERGRVDPNVSGGPGRTINLIVQGLGLDEAVERIVNRLRREELVSQLGLPA